MTDIKNKILKLVNKNNEYVLALSGGVDSAVLASIFNELNLSYRTILLIIIRKTLVYYKNLLKKLQKILKQAMKI